MALQTEALKKALEGDILDILNKPISEKSTDEEVKKRFAKDLADAVGNRLDAWVKTGVVSVAAGIPVSTTGSPAAQTGFTTGPGTGTIS